VSATPPYRTLIIDDDARVHEVFASTLSGAVTRPARSRPAGPVLPAAQFPVFEVDSAFNGQQGLELVQKALAEHRPYTMAFVDMRMKLGWDGIETIDRIWRECYDLQIIICTGHTDFTWHDIIKRFGHTDRLLTLKKPFNVMDVRQMAYALAEKWNLFNQAKSHLERLQKLVAERTAKLQESNESLQRKIMEQKQAERERRMMEIQLRHAQKLESVGRLAAGIAHEINTPTQYIGDNLRFLQQSCAQLIPLLRQHERLLRAVQENTATPELAAELQQALRQCDLDFLIAETPRAIEQSLHGVHCVTRIVHSMRDFSHPGSGEKIPTDLNQTVENTLVLAANEWKYVANIVKDFQPGLPRVLCLPGELNQVILNLVVNAAHAIADATGADAQCGANAARRGEPPQPIAGATGGDAPQKGTITIATRRDGDWVEIQVADTGTGIPEAIRDKIFDPFFTTRPVGQGTGQGLAIARNVIVARHNGTLTFQTRDGAGTVFTIRLPIHPVPLTQIEEKAA
jgi:signal transduction histidine kinase